MENRKLLFAKLRFKTSYILMDLVDKLWLSFVDPSSLRIPFEGFAEFTSLPPLNRRLWWGSDFERRIVIVKVRILVAVNRATVNAVIHFATRVVANRERVAFLFKLITSLDETRREAKASLDALKDVYLMILSKLPPADNMKLTKRLKSFSPAFAFESSKSGHWTFPLVTRLGLTAQTAATMRAEAEKMRIRRAELLRQRLLKREIANQRRQKRKRDEMKRSSSLEQNERQQPPQPTQKSPPQQEKAQQQKPQQQKPQQQKSQQQKPQQKPEVNDQPLTKKKRKKLRLAAEIKDWPELQATQQADLSKQGGPSRLATKVKGKEKDKEGTNVLLRKEKNSEKVKKKERRLSPEARVTKEKAIKTKSIEPGEKLKSQPVKTTKQKSSEREGQTKEKAKIQNKPVRPGEKSKTQPRKSTKQTAQEREEHTKENVKVQNKPVQLGGNPTFQQGKCTKQKILEMKERTKKKGKKEKGTISSPPQKPVGEDQLVPEQRQQQQQPQPHQPQPHQPSDVQKSANCAPVIQDLPSKEDALTDLVSWATQTLLEKASMSESNAVFERASRILPSTSLPAFVFYLIRALNEARGKDYPFLVFNSLLTKLEDGDRANLFKSLYKSLFSDRYSPCQLAFYLKFRHASLTGPILTLGHQPRLRKSAFDFLSLYADILSAEDRDSALKYLRRVLDSSYDDRKRILLEAFDVKRGETFTIPEFPNLSRDGSLRTVIRKIESGAFKNYGTKGKKTGRFELKRL